jgi:hypothetical protein
MRFEGHGSQIISDVVFLFLYLTFIDLLHGGHPFAFTCEFIAKLKEFRKRSGSFTILFCDDDGLADCVFFFLQNFAHLCHQERIVFYFVFHAGERG